ncbi:MAG: cytochrome c biogenesis protein CcsA [Gammaproteobacteria bacterium]|nr:cytochrome c biogenesis protein CcsA [Gammaproteobacteria bacterium]
MTVISILAIALYLATGALLLRSLLHYQEQQTRGTKSKLLLPGILGLALHAWILYHGLFSPAGLDLGFFNIFSLVGWLIALLLLTSALREPIESLGIIVMPFTSLALLLEQLSDQHHYLSQTLTPGLEFHILISILAYSLLSIAMVQALLLYIQDAHLHNKHPGGYIRALPPLQTMETMLFRMIGLGFLVLSTSLLSGFIFMENMFAQHLVHKTILSIIAWLLFSILLWGRWQFGWRGRTAIRWAMSGFIALMLAYFGSKFVVELILQR